ncbi:uncharacterized protein MYCFIDRAFT_210407 [Pseudocercospora fijiensis CIRAD86]|uniref:Large ribosomal subunit protein mL44 n=1 Tax=Pseudocercospora fijiensis (strain CIRAD86) TaxID=383855 RepID=M3B9U3_PSEFD|nr:uncharacterized protein MYCFIDRAFT_210407 [Pseudocercospora fijiensis CIRAD86]EME86097.1 hypothetical protein MYCFIDRAFT_210407 [Pseudocercospora fijiensis CIRAD86]
MKSIRLDRWASQLQPPRNPRLYLLTRRCPFSTEARQCIPTRELQRNQQQASAQCIQQRRSITKRRKASTAATQQAQEEAEAFCTDEPDLQLESDETPRIPLNFPSHGQAVQSAKLSALHARLSLPSKLPIQTVARCLIDHSVDRRPGYNNASLAVLGQELLGYYTSEWLICKYPRIPMSILFAAQYGYVGPATLNSMRMEWGVEAVAAPGPEVDPGLLQFKRLTPGNAMAEDGKQRVKDVLQGQLQTSLRGTGRYLKEKRGMSNRIVHDDEFGDITVGPPGAFPSDNKAPYAGAPIAVSQASDPAMEHAVGAGIEGGEVEITMPPKTLELQPQDIDMDTEPVSMTDASASFVRALVGALYLHAGTEAAKAFHKAHVLSRHLELHKMFDFKYPTRDLSILCRREGFEPPVARLISETGRLSRTPVFVVGVFSGNDKLGEGAGSSLNEGRVRAAAAALRSWYLYSPPPSEIVLPSEVEGSSKIQKVWKPQLVDPGEIVQ